MFWFALNNPETPVSLYTHEDDSTLFEMCNIKRESDLQHSVDITGRWTRQNDMNINTDKSKEMLISFV